jgi:hydroxymethylbilane synthase
MKLSLGSRKSQLALTQASLVKDLLQSFHSHIEVEIVPISTKGDEWNDRSLKEIGGKGVFVKEIEQQLLRQTIDLAVHSMKDVPSLLLAGLSIPCILEREDRRDVLILKQPDDQSEFPQFLNCKTIGTSSLRRSAQLKALAPHCRVVELRGNVDTRLQKLRREPQLDGIILAQAGLTRLGLGLSRQHTWFFPLDQMLPASGQGALGIEIRGHDSNLTNLLQSLNCPRTAIEVAAERAFMAAIGGSCQAPVAATAEISPQDPGVLTLTAKVISEEGSDSICDRLSDNPQNAQELGRRMAETLRAKGADRILSRYQ